MTECPNFPGNEGPGTFSAKITTHPGRPGRLVKLTGFLSSVPSAFEAKLHEGEGLLCPPLSPPPHLLSSLFQPPGPLFASLL